MYIRPTAAAAAIASNARVSSRTALDAMSQLSPVVFLHDPKSAPAGPEAPKLIAIFSWMAARDQHIAKYVSHYQALYPASAILLVKCPIENAIWHGKGRREVAPAAPALRALFPDAGTGEAAREPELLLHLFSNGGCSAFDAFLEAYHEGGAEELPRHVCVMDSCPGVFSWARAHRAVSAPLPKWMSPLVHLLLAVQVVAGWLFAGSRKERWRWGTKLNEEPVLRTQARRLYLYSDTDEMVDYRDVEAHAERARDVGMADDVMMVNFGASGHVSHARTDPKTYWEAVKDVWGGW